MLAQGGGGSVYGSADCGCSDPTFANGLEQFKLDVTAETAKAA